MERWELGRAELFEMVFAVYTVESSPLTQGHRPEIRFRSKTPRFGICKHDEFVNSLQQEHSFGFEVFV